MNAARLAALTSWNAEWAGLRVVVLGAGKTGFSVADTLMELGARVLVLADAVDERTGEMLAVIGAERGDARDLDAFAPELAVVSPGFRPDDERIARLESLGVPIWGDIELAWRVRDKTGTPAEWVLVTGTNGKTTTTQLTAAMIAADGRRVAACGNIGTPVLDVIRYPAGFDVLVVELSSFQLHWMHRNAGGEVTPWAAVCLNVADDHLDWHGGAAGYHAAKAKVYENTRIAAVYNTADEVTRGFVEEAEVIEGCRAIGFGLGIPGPSEFGIVEGILCDRAFLDDRRNSAIELTTLDDLERVGLRAPHLVADVLAASALARSLDVPPTVIARALAEFAVDAHRTQHVAERDGIRWVDDSKATNPHAAAASLGSFGSVVWIVGGLLKGVDLAPLVQAHAARVSAAVVIGVDRQPVVEAFARHAPALPLFEVTETDTGRVMTEAVRLSARAARAGDVVLLAPAAASMDQFADYADRGRRFTAAVHEYLGSGAHDDDQTGTGEHRS